MTDDRQIDEIGRERKREIEASPCINSLQHSAAELLYVWHRFLNIDFSEHLRRAMPLWNYLWNHSQDIGKLESRITACYEDSEVYQLNYLGWHHM